MAKVKTKKKVSEYQVTLSPYEARLLRDMLSVTVFADITAFSSMLDILDAFENAGLYYEDEVKVGRSPLEPDCLYITNSY